MAVLAAAARLALRGCSSFSIVCESDRPITIDAASGTCTPTPIPEAYLASLPIHSLVIARFNRSVAGSSIQILMKEVRCHPQEPATQNNGDDPYLEAKQGD